MLTRHLTPRNRPASGDTIGLDTRLREAIVESKLNRLVPHSVDLFVAGYFEVRR